MRYLVTYDLRTPGQDYERLFDALRKLGATRNLASVWTLQYANTSSERLRDYLWQYMDANDLLLVVHFDDWAGYVLGTIT